MKTLFAVVTVGAVLMSGLMISSQVQAEPEINEALVNAKVDARLHQVLIELRQQTAARHGS